MNNPPISSPTASDETRRRLLKGFAGGLALAVVSTGEVYAQASAPSGFATPVPPVKYGGERMPGGLVDDPLVFVAIAPDGTVTVVCHRQEMGQGVRTSIPMVVAEELEADLKRVRVTQATGDEKRYGNQNTDGSRSMRHSMDPLRRVGASARMMLEAAAAAQWGVPDEERRGFNEAANRPRNLSFS